MMIQNITLGEIAVALSFLVGFFGGIGYFYKNIKKWLEKIIGEQFAPFNEQIKQVDMESCKNYLVRCLGDFEHGNPLSDVEQERFWEEYQHYLRIGGNSYIERRVEKLKLDGKL